MSAREDYARTKSRGASRDSPWEFSPTQYDAAMDEIDTGRARVALALKAAFDYGTIDGDHHKMWVIDQMVRALTGDGYEQWVRDYIEPDMDADIWPEWDEGIAP